MPRSGSDFPRVGLEERLKHEPIGQQQLVFDLEPGMGTPEAPT